MAEDESTLYFGYGSNLDIDDWNIWCEEKGVDPSGVDELGPCWLPDHRLKFHYRSFRREGGAADVIPAGCGHAVPGVLFSLTENALANMDRKEGHPNTYRRTTVKVILPDGSSTEAITYRLQPAKQGEYVPPTSYYASLIEGGLNKRKLPIEDLKNAIGNSDYSYPVKHLFVYGTLMQDQVRHETLIQHTTEGHRKADAPGTLYHLGAYPGMLTQPEGRVLGEVHELSNVFLGLQSLDRVEGFYGFDSTDSLFQRTLMEIEVADEKVWAWTYIYNGTVNDAVVLASGDWRTANS
tara:strand:+ start:386 stop:1267 length:882 start_codon:yes stop_codon:yes gene_type:complete